MISGDLAHRCLQTVPIEVDSVVSLVDQYRKYLEFQSTLEILKGLPNTFFFLFFGKDANR